MLLTVGFGIGILMTLIVNWATLENNERERARAVADLQVLAQKAQQQVQLAITFLQANRDEIIRGRNQAFNDVFGKVGTLKRVAVLAPVSLPGQFNLVSPTLLRDNGAQGGGGGNNRPTVGSVGTQLRSGDSLFLIDPADPQNTKEALIGASQLYLRDQYGVVFHHSSLRYYFPGTNFISQAIGEEGAKQWKLPDERYHMVF